MKHSIIAVLATELASMSPPALCVRSPATVAHQLALTVFWSSRTCCFKSFRFAQFARLPSSLIIYLEIQYMDCRPKVVFVTCSAVAWSCASALHVICGSVFHYSPRLSSLYLSFLPSSWLEYWWSSLWIWLSPRSAESDSRHKYLGASEKETSWLKRTERRSGFYPWWKSMWLDRSQSDSTCQL